MEISVEEKAIYRHYKGNFYYVHAIAKHAETGEDLVFYQQLKANCLYDVVWDRFSKEIPMEPDKKWCRPIDMFESEVEVDGITTPRFQFVTKSIK